MSGIYRVAVLGFSDFERRTLASCFALARHRNPSYESSSVLDESDFVLADADHAPSVQLVAATDRLAETVFVGRQRPARAVAWSTRPLDPLRVMRALDTLALPAAGGAVPRPLEPPAEPEAQASAPAPAAPAPAAPSAPSAPPSALLVDDSPTALRELSSRLQPWGLAVDCVRNSSQAIERLAQRTYDFVFLDLELGADSDLDGLALCKHIKRDHPLPGSVVVIVSAHDGELDHVRGALAGCDAYLGKPLQAAALERLLLRQGLEAPAPRAQPA
ncbi:MAG: response regulator [Rubrivivax sp.]|nr:response regulator [Rubrivivax sp.]